MFREHSIFYLKPSRKISTNPRGLHTKILLPKGTMISEYKGKIRTEKEAEDIADRCRQKYVRSKNAKDMEPCVYFFGVSGDNGKKWVIDGYKSKSPAVYVNADKTLVNAEFVQTKDRVFLIALSDIRPGSEIIAHYGEHTDRIIAHDI